VLLAKKRYVGFKFEKRTDSVPIFDAKGIETVRRDGNPAQQKIEEAALKILFRTSNLSLVKDYFQRQCFKILSNKVSIQDFCFAKEVKLGTYRFAIDFFQQLTNLGRMASLLLERSSALVR
jgi:DNA polymerase zeta